MIMIFDYASKKELKANLGKPLKYQETSLFGAQYLDNGILYGSNRPHLTRHKREFFANVVMKNGLIEKVE